MHSGAALFFFVVIECFLQAAIEHAWFGMAGDTVAVQAEDVVENAELVLFYVKECYVYMIPPRKSSASYRADEWNVNKWEWEGALKVVSKGEECTIRLEDKVSGELYAQAPVRKDEHFPIERVIDSSRYFVLRVEDNSSGKPRHAFIGIGFRERPEAYDFEAALYDHIKYLNKKKHAEEMEQEYQSKPSADYSIKEGKTIRLALKTQHSGFTVKSNFHDTPSPKRSSSTAGVPALAPPPIFSKPSSEDHVKAEDVADPDVDAEEEFGDFQAA